MELIERTSYLSSLEDQFGSILKGEGHCVFITGEAGIGKTSLVKLFCRSKINECSIYQGTCDALFTPRPLAPLFDIVWQINSELWEQHSDLGGRAELFGRIFHELAAQRKPILMVFEDIHWADEATLDFIKFLARRINRLRCLFILTYRDDEIHAHHPLRNVLGQLPNDHFTRFQLLPLSREAVEQMAMGKGYNGEDVFTISGGNPFYVNEILASYSPGVPDNIKDSILSVYNRRDDVTRHVWQFLSVLPTGFEIRYLEKVDPSYIPAVENSLSSRILILKDGIIRFKHELYRRTIESSLSPLLRVKMHRNILGLFLQSFEDHNETERIVHHAKNANDYDLVVKYAPMAARQAASLGAHAEAAKLYYTAIEYYQGNERAFLSSLYEAYSYECYLTSQIREAIIYQGRLLKLWREVDDLDRIGSCLWFLSRLWWYDGNRKQAEYFAQQAIQVLSDQPSSKAKAMAFSNVSQLKMLSDETEEAIYWGEKAIAIAKELGDEEILCHALNNVGTATANKLNDEGAAMMQESLALALKNGYHEHAARAYTNLGCCWVRLRDFPTARKTLEEGVAYCDERDLGSWSTYMLSWLAREHLETNRWNGANEIAGRLLKREHLPTVVAISTLVVMATIRMRKGEEEVLPLLTEAKVKAFEAMELQRIGPVMRALLEYEWLTGENYIGQDAIDNTVEMIRHADNDFEASKFAFWMQKARSVDIGYTGLFEGYRVSGEAEARAAALVWERLGCPYEQALVLYEGCEDDKRKAISIVQGLGANAIYEKMKLEMRSSGIRSIPRGLRKSTSSNAAYLTDRELDVLRLLREGMQNKEIASRLFISAKTVDHHISAILFKLDVNSRVKAVQEAVHRKIII